MHIKTKLIITQVMILFYLTSTTDAYSQTANQFYPVLKLTAGVASAELGQNHLFSIGDNQFDYSANQHSYTEFFPGAFLGVEIPIQAKMNIQVGISYSQLPIFPENGILTQGVDAQSADQYGYNFDIRSQQVLAEGKLLWHPYANLNPYLLFGIGAAFNEASAYKTSLGCTNLSLTPSFGNASNTALSYSLGLGMDVDVVKNFRLGVGYRFTSLGTSELANGYVGNTPINHKLQESNLHLQEFVIELTYINN